MSDGDLLKQIADLAGAINRHKNSSQNGSSRNIQNEHSERQSYSTVQGGYSRGPSYRGRYRGRISLSRNGISKHSTNRVTHRNRTLVLNSGSTSADQSANDQSNQEAVSAVPLPQFVSKRDRHMQLINTTVYSDRAQARTKAMEQSRLAKDALKQTKINQRRLAKKQFLEQDRERAEKLIGSREFVEIDGVKYHVGHNGSKLTRVGYDSHDSPRKAVVDGVTFIRSKNGNLWLRGAVAAKKRDLVKAKSSIPCRYFTMTGTCQRGHNCPYLHSSSHVALCPNFLQNRCQNQSCDMSHEPTPHNAPLCVHFQRGNCNRSDCKYSHMRLSPDARICREFATTGYCEKGEQCTERHVFECPDFEATGKCSKADKGKCKLKHIVRAGAGHHEVSAEGSVASDDLFMTDTDGGASVIGDDVFDGVRAHLQDDKYEPLQLSSSGEDNEDHSGPDYDEDLEFDSDMLENVDDLDMTDDRDDDDNSVDFKNGTEYIEV
ncbi:uncharacterized protein V1516DRAFT_676028 [Lipomyces oligophaga]|uniref:uncharacterized protein n=1 Tax=Lipomyces oligophaga TaxID=45792 RepID=UPI0034CE3E82